VDNAHDTLIEKGEYNPQTKRYEDPIEVISKRDLKLLGWVDDGKSVIAASSLPTKSLIVAPCCVLKPVNQLGVNPLNLFF